MYKVMIVDDVEIFRRELKRLPVWGEVSGFVIAEEAWDGADALKKLASNPVDLIITDIRMPNMDGLELLHTVSEKKLCPATVLLSDFTEYVYARQGMLYGAFDYIGKPANEKQLLELLNRISVHLAELGENQRKQRALQGLTGDSESIIEALKQVIVLIRSKSPNALLAAVNLMDRIYDFYADDVFKGRHIIKNSFQEIIGQVVQTYDWIDKYADVERAMAEDFSNHRGLRETSDKIKTTLEELFCTINKLMHHHSSNLVNHTCEYVLHHIDENISVQLLAERLFVNRSYLSQVFKQCFDMTLLQYINMVKMERAKKLLQEGKLRTCEIAELLGFQDHEYFTKLFKKHIGMLPRDCKT